MTSIDRAFIKAYELQDAAEGLSEPPVEPPAEPAAEMETPGDREAAFTPEADSTASEERPTTPAGHPFQPAFQVDGFAWPSGCTRLSMAAGDQVDQLADALVCGLDRGQQVVAISGCGRGDGCTTLLLCAARRLAEYGLKVALVDADFDNPLLARRLGLLPEVGWEEVLAGLATVRDVAIESVQDHIAVLPLCGSPSDEDPPAGDLPDPATRLNVLREHYDLVLVDLGRFADEAAGAKGTAEAVLGWIDAVVLVHNVRSTPPDELNRTRARIQAAGLVEAGITENFAVHQSA